jgi:putative DNA primase/helicase
MSAKLFYLADEVIAREDVHHKKNKMKGLVTGSQIRINPKNVCSHMEANHANFVLNSNEFLVVSINTADRRYTVVSCPPKLSDEYYDAVIAERDDGGIAGTIYRLLDVPLDGFKENSQFRITQAKEDMIELAMPPAQKFITEWLHQEIENLPLEICKLAQGYEAFHIWCKRSGVRSFCSKTMFSKELVRAGFKKDVIGVENNGKRTNIAFVTPPKGREPNPGEAQKWFFKSCEQDFDKILEMFR